MLETLFLFIFISGYIVGLGAVTVIDTLGFLAQKSQYYTLTTIRAHKVTKPLIWLGLSLKMIGGVGFYYFTQISAYAGAHFVVTLMLIANGLYLSFYISPKLLKKERDEGDTITLISEDMQNNITISFLFSFIGWWSSVLILVLRLLNG